jgi:DEAD/DEAH box helicase domain-containing protein
MLSNRDAPPLRGKMGRLASLIEQTIRASNALEIVGTPKTFPRKPPAFYAGPLRLSPCLREYVAQSFPQGLWVHQGKALYSVLSGNNTVVTTPTSSGKTLVFTLPAAQNILDESKSCALFIYPTKAVTNDQLNFVRNLLKTVGLGQVWAEKYDGSTPQHYRNEVRQKAQIVLTNPDMLHIGILNNHDKWMRFFGNLKLVVLDEAHEYRGVFGSNVAFLIRRLRQVSALYGATPSFVAASATATNAMEHLTNLTNLPFSPVGPEEDGSEQGERAYILCRPRGVNYIDAATRLTVSLVRQGVSILTFCPSRVIAEKKFYGAVRANREVADRLAVYRAGLKAQERERIETELKRGNIKGVFSTNAQELGIDIGVLDACILVGFPPTMMSMWQRSGRVGRSGKEGVIIVVASDNLIDRYFLDHQDEFFGRSNEKLVTSLENETILIDHLACAKKEVNGEYTRIDVGIFGPQFKELLERYSRHEIDDSLLYSDNPHPEVSIRNIRDAQYSIRCGSEDIGEISAQQILTEAYEGAVYYHGGQKYRVKHIVEGERRVIVDPEPSPKETRHLTKVRIEKGSPFKVKKWPRFQIAFSHMKVFQVTGAYIELGEDGKPVGQFPTRPRTREFPTHGFYLELGKETVTELSAGQPLARVAAGLHGMEHVMAGLVPVLVPCDPFDFNSETVCKQGENAAVLIYDNVHGGIGLSECAYDNFETLLDRSLELISSCDCTYEQGCPFCIQSSRCFEFNENLDKGTALSILRQLREWCKAEPEVTREFAKAGAMTPHPAAPEVTSVALPK